MKDVVPSVIIVAKIQSWWEVKVHIILSLQAIASAVPIVSTTKPNLLEFLFWAHIPSHHNICLFGTFPYTTPCRCLHRTIVCFKGHTPLLIHLVAYTLHDMGQCPWLKGQLSALELSRFIFFYFFIQRILLHWYRDVDIGYGRGTRKSLH